MKTLFYNYKDNYYMYFMKFQILLFFGKIFSLIEIPLKVVKH